jgi:hypothetical protein
MRFVGYCLVTLIGVFPIAARAQDLQTAHAFVAGLYAAYHGRGPDYLGAQAKTTFYPPLLRLFRRVAAATPKDEVGALDGDPICNCQDFQISKVNIQVTGGPTGQARATVRFRNAGKPQIVRLDLVPVQGQWRVSDVHTSDTPSLVSYLTQSLGSAH